jgi:hypothetical protein
MHFLINVYKSDKILHLIIGALLCVSVIFVSSSIWMMTQANSGVQVLVENMAPQIILGPVIAGQIGGVEVYSDNTLNNLISGTSRIIYVEGLVQDLNGREDLANVTVVMHRSDNLSTCTESAEKCIKNTNCLLTNVVNPYRKAFSCLLSLPYYMDATDDSAGPHSSLNWKVTAIVTDDNGAAAIDNSRAIEVRSLVSLDIPNTISFGDRDMNSVTTSSDNLAQTITQWGNVRQDLRVKMTTDGFFCTGSDIGIPRSSMKWALTDIGFDSPSSTAVASSYVDTNFAITKRTSSAAVTKNFYWNLSIPYGVSGSCSATLDILAKNANLP